MKSKRSNTTFWGVGLAAIIIYVAMALSQPNGSTSLVGRGVAWLVALLPAPAPVAPSPTTAGVSPPTPALGPAPPPPVPLSPPPAEKKAAAKTTFDLAAGEFPPAKTLAQDAVRARAKMSHAPKEIEFREVHATIVAGTFNGDRPGEPYLGYCGEMNVPAGEGWGRAGWKPFFVSNTRAAVRGQTAYLNVANPLGIEKCTGKRMSWDFAALFNAGPTETRRLID